MTQPDAYESQLAVRESANVAPIEPPSFFLNMSPRERIAFATDVADQLKPIITQKKLAHKFGQGEHIELEGWQTCGFLCGMACEVEWTRPLADGNGFEARAFVIRVDSGIKIGAGESECSRAEQNWRNSANYAIRSMAQTRAQSRAWRGVLAWIMVLAGYKPTPAEEMPREAQAPAAQTIDEHPKDRAKRLGINNLIEWAAQRKCAWKQSALHAELDRYEAERAASAHVPKSVKKPTAAQKKMYFALCGELNMDDEQRHAFNAIVSDKQSFSQFTFDDAHAAIDELNYRLDTQNAGE